MQEFFSELKSAALNWIFYRRVVESTTISDQMSVEFYDIHHTHQFSDCPNHPFSLFVRKFFPLMEEGVHNYIDNLNTELKFLKVNELILPIMINKAEYDNAYICSPYGFYISYALEYVNIIKNPFLKFIITRLLHFLEKIFRKGEINKVIHVNNLPFATTVHPKMDERTLRSVINFLSQQFPEHAIIFRALNSQLNAAESQALKQMGSSLIAYWQVYLLDTNDPQSFCGKTYKKDLKFFKKINYDILAEDQFTEEDIVTIKNLYEDVSVHQRSNLNLKMNQKFIDFLIRNKVLKFRALRRNGEIEAVMGYVCCEGVLISPILGYHRHLKDSLDLYKSLAMLLTLEAKEEKSVINWGAGASHFKKNRKAQGYLEYIAVYDKHLPWFRRVPWKLLKAFIHPLGVHYMKKY